MSDSHNTLSSPTRADALTRAWQSAVAALLGAFIVLAVGFAGLPQLHDAAHDTRHTLNFPCH
jgi:cobalt transporter subunit CbtB